MYVLTTACQLQPKRNPLQALQIQSTPVPKTCPVSALIPSRIIVQFTNSSLSPAAIPPAIVSPDATSNFPDQSVSLSHNIVAPACPSPLLDHSVSSSPADSAVPLPLRRSSKPSKSLIWHHDYLTSKPKSSCIGFGINQHWLYLDVLMLLNKAFEGVPWNVNDTEFPELKYLKLDSFNFAQWSISDDLFPSLESLVLTNSEEIQTTQREDMANDAFTVTIQPPDWDTRSSP
ncbi:hypothetical protein H5410_025650 [Solanum commersonii]|uniref:Uncharacterized protein n=1 Tax=Solanum commersonii TaxID=4109 RepID=A0A9J5YZ58_SOLCO|nr:hypothetical protein H5410_025650 [Solanum commersonii]